MLARDGKRIRRSALWCTCSPDPESDTMSVAYATGRALGPAVIRNRLRRRLRAVMRESDLAHPLPPGLMLIGARPAAIELTFDQLQTELESILSEVHQVCKA